MPKIVVNSKFSIFLALTPPENVNLKFLSDQIKSTKQPTTRVVNKKIKKLFDIP